MTTATKPCHPRRRYSTKEQAGTAARSIAARGGALRLPEPCHHCNGWHLN